MFSKLLNFSIKWKLIVSFAAIVTVFLITALFNLNQVNQINSQLKNQNATVALKQLALELKETVQDLNVIGSGLEISRDPSYGQESC
jgi:methyl-accepting chemotaxis protein